MDKKDLKKNLKTGTKKAGGLAKEFRDFISRGNVVDLAVGVIIGGAFGKITTSLVNDIVMPAVGVLLGGVDFSSLSVTVGGAHIAYGAFIQNIIDFLIIAVCIFIFIKIINGVHNKTKSQQTEDKVQKKKEDEQLAILKEIRDSLKKR